MTEQNKFPKEERKILQARYAGKWIELWWEDGHRKLDFDACSKQYMLWDAVEAANLKHHVLTYGIKSLIIIREHDGSNYEITAVKLDKDLDE